MPVILANTIWAPLFVYLYDWPWALCATAIGFLAEFGVFRLYTRSLVAQADPFRKLVVANLISYVAGIFLMPFVPFTIPKGSLTDTALAFFIGYLITLPIEYRVLRSLFPPPDRPLLVRAVVMSNFISYAILFAGYVLWFGGPFFLIRRWMGDI